MTQIDSTGASNKRRVCHLTLSHTPFDVRVFEKECRTLAAAGYDVHLAVPNARESEVRDGVTMHDIPTSHGANPIARWKARLQQTYAVARRIDADIYHLHDPELIPAGLKLARLGARIIYDAHEDAPLEAWSLNRGRPLHRIVLTTLWWGLLQQAKRRFDFFVCATPQIARRFPQARSVEVRNYPRLEMFPVSASQRPRGRDLVFAGLVSETRGAIEMLDALAAVRSPGIRLKLFGTIATGTLRRRMEEHPAWSRVDYVGHRPWREVLDEYGRALGGLLLYESTPEQLHCMPVKLFEFLLGGVPVIASDIPFWRDLLDGNPAVIFVNIKDPAAIERIAVDPQLAAGMGQAGQGHARARFNWDAEGAKLVEVYAQVLSRAQKFKP